MVNASQAAASVNTNQATRKARRLYVGNLPPLGTVIPPVSEQNLLEFFNAVVIGFGLNNPEPGNPIASTWINTDGKYGFLEFRSIEECTRGLALNGIVFQGRNLKIARPNDYQPPPGGETTLIPTLDPSKMGPEAASLFPGLTATSMTISSQTPSRILVLNNLVTMEILADMEEVEGIKEEVGEECNKYGQVVRVIIPLPSEAEERVGKVFVEFSETEHAQKAAQILSGRMFDHRKVETDYLTEEQFTELFPEVFTSKEEYKIEQDSE